MILSEIEEGHESQASDSGETVTGPLRDSTDTEDTSEAALRSLERDVSVRKNTVVSVGQQENEIHEESSSPSAHLRQEQLPTAKTRISSTTTSKDKIETSSPVPTTPGGRSITSSFGSRHVILSRRGLSTESNESHGRSSISTANTDSWMGRMQEVERDSIDDDAAVDYQDDDGNNDEYQQQNIDDAAEDRQENPQDKTPTGHQSLEGLKDRSGHESKVTQDVMTDSLTQPPTALVSSSDSSSLSAAVPFPASGNVVEVMKQREDEFSEDSLKEETASSTGDAAPSQTRQQQIRKGCMLASADSLDLDVMNWSFRSEVTSSMVMMSSVEFVASEPKLAEVEQGNYDEQMRKNLASTKLLPVSVIAPSNVSSYSCESSLETSATSSSEHKMIITEGNKAVEEAFSRTSSSYTTAITKTATTTHDSLLETPAAKSVSGGNSNNSRTSDAAASSTAAVSS
jgi:hypothetical protein